VATGLLNARDDLRRDVMLDKHRVVSSLAMWPYPELHPSCHGGTPSGDAKIIINLSLYNYKTKGWSGIGEDHDSCTS
jgi:hypothetical protein